MAVLFTLQKAYLDYHVFLSSKTVLQSPVHVLVYGQVLIHALKRVYLIEQSLKAKQAEIKDKTKVYVDEIEVQKLKEVNAWDGKGKNLVLVTHYSIITAVTNSIPSSGEIVITDKDFIVINTIVTD